jgi:hypothetical protein
MTDNNRLFGAIPTELGLLTDLMFLDLGKIDGKCAGYCCTGTGGDCLTHVAILCGHDIVMYCDNPNDR